LFGEPPEKKIPPIKCDESLKVLATPPNVYDTDLNDVQNWIEDIQEECLELETIFEKGNATEEEVWAMTENRLRIR